MRTLWVIVAAALLASTAPASAQIEVDVELVLAVDVSRSMDEDERLLQRNGYAAAFRHREVIRAIESGLVGRIAVSYFEWAGPGRNKIVAPWTIISNAGQAHAFADVLDQSPPGRDRGTSISNGLNFGVELLDRSPARGLRRVIDVSGDGPNNVGEPVAKTRDDVIARGIIVNGLPVVIRPASASSFYDIADLDIYYQDCVIGGPGAFLVTVTDTSQFEIAIRRKLVLEIAGRPARVMPAQYDARPRVDCLIGEKARARRLRNLNDP